jgi:hypothetical protein
VLAWSAEGDGALSGVVTAWVRDHGQGGATVLAKRDGLVVASPDGHLWQLVPRARPWAFLDCVCFIERVRGAPDDGDGDDGDAEAAVNACRTAGEVTDWVWVALDAPDLKAPLGLTIQGGPDLRAPGAFAEEAPTRYADHALDVYALGGFGPYLFLRESLFLFGCGAHPVMESRLTVLDLAAGRALTAAEAMPAPDDAARLATLAALSPGPDPAPDPATDPADAGTLTALWPTFQARKDAPWWWTYQASRPDCFVCSDHRWSAYTTSTYLISPEPVAPWAARLTPWADALPLALRAWAELPTGPDLPHRGFSVITAPTDARAALLDAFTRP